MKERRNWKTWLLPSIVAVALSSALIFTASSARVEAHIESESIHKDVESLDERYMPREVLYEMFDNLQETLDRIEQKIGE